MRIVDLRRPPPRASRLLAGDQAVSVARPLLTHSRDLDDTLLIEVAGSMSEDHRLAICGRSDLDHALADVLAPCGGARVAAALLANPGAPLSECTLDRLMTLAARIGGGRGAARCALAYRSGT